MIGMMSVVVEPMSTKSASRRVARGERSAVACQLAEATRSDARAAASASKASPSRRHRRGCRRQAAPSVSPQSCATPSARVGKMSESSPVMVTALQRRIAERWRAPAANAASSRSSPCQSGQAISTAPVTRPSSIRARLQVRAADVPARARSSPFRSSRRSTYKRRAEAGNGSHSGHRPEGRRRGARAPWRPRLLSPDRDAAQPRRSEPRRRGRRAAFAASVPHALCRRPRRDRRTRRLRRRSSTGIAEAFPQLALWVDNGCAELDAAEAFLARFAGRLAGARLGIAARRGARRRAPQRSARHPLARFSRRELSRAAGHCFDDAEPLAARA